MTIWKAKVYLTYVGTGSKTTDEKQIEAETREQAEILADQWSATYDHKGFVVDKVEVEPVE